jgi:hypothetical protein
VAVLTVGGVRVCGGGMPDRGGSMRIVVADTTASGTETARVLLEDVPSPVRLRELIRHRVREEVARADGVCGDWEVQAEAAVRAFGRNGFFVFVGDRQVEDLNEELTLAEADVVSFVRLVPLAGG